MLQTIDVLLANWREDVTVGRWDRPRDFIDRAR
jgi:hypothetical protein